MYLIWGIIIISITLKAWIGQTIIALSPKVAAKIKITEPESNVDSTYFKDMHGEAIWDAMILWTLPAAGVLLIINDGLWPYFGLIGGGIYLYFAGRGIVSRMIMQRHGINLGESKLKLNFFLTLWGLTAIITIILAIDMFAV